MQAEKVNNLLLLCKNRIPENRFSDLTLCFQQLPDEYFDYVKSIHLKSPKQAMYLSIFAGFLGIDRFYIGDTITGVQKLLFSWLTLGVWPLVDIFITYRLCKEENYLTITNSIKELI